MEHFQERSKPFTDGASLFFLVLLLLAITGGSDMDQCPLLIHNGAMKDS